MTGTEHIPITAPERVLALGWHDGATTGLAEYRGYPHLFQFELVTSVISEPRVFILRSSPVSDLSELDDALSPLGNPRFPVWAPVWRFQSESEKTRADEAIQSAMPPSLPVIAVVVADTIQATPTIARAIVTDRDREELDALRSRSASVKEWRNFCRPSG